MKMRKRIAALIAVAMIAALMPMSTFAASANTVTYAVKVAKDTKLVNGTPGPGEATAPELKIDLKDDLTTGQAFFVTLDNAEWDGDLVEGASYVLDSNGVLSGTINVEKTGDKTATVTGVVDKGNVIHIPLLTELKGGEATVAVDGEGSVVNSSEIIFATAPDAGVASKIVIGDAPSFSEKGDIASIKIEEPFQGAYASSTKDITFEIELRDSDFQFVLTEQDLTDPDSDNHIAGTRIEGDRGFAGFEAAWDGTNDSSTNSNVKFEIKDRGTSLTLTIKPAAFSSNIRGNLYIKDLKIKRVSRNATKGDVKAVLRGELVDGSEIAVIAKHTDFTTKLEDTAKETKEVVTGNEVGVEFKLSEEIANSLFSNRTVDFELSKDIKFKRGSVKVNKVKDAHEDDTKEAVTDRITIENDFNTFVVDGFNTDATKKAQYTFEATLLVPNSYDKDEITLTATGRALTDTHEIVIAKVKKPVTVEVTPLDIKVGLKKQVGGKIVIKENEKEALNKSVKHIESKNGTESERNEDAYLSIRLADRDSGLKIKDADIEVTEGDLVLDLDDKFISDGWIQVRVKRQSTEASTIEITNIEVSADRTVPEGKYDIKVGGTALSANAYRSEFNQRSLRDDIFVDDFTNADGDRVYIVEFFDPIVTEEFINITTKNTEDFAPGAGAKVVSFVIGNNKFIADGVEVEMDAAPYIKDGRTMVPVRYLATALGIKENAIKFDAGLVTIFKNDGTILQLQVGSKNLVANGMTIPMVAAAEIIDGRTYVPVTEIGGVFGVSGSWDSVTQTATFK